MKNRKEWCRQAFLLSAALLLGATATLKLLGLWWSFSREPNPVFPILPDGTVLMMAAVLELAIAYLVWNNRFSFMLKLGLVMWFSVGVLTYRLASIGYAHRCSCLGPLPLSDRIYEGTAKALLGYLLIGSIGMFVWNRAWKGQMLINSQHPAIEQQ